jgi:hypothetical protein
VSAYDLEYPRYGTVRSGTAVTIFVTESQSRSTRVKPERPDADGFGVVKLNLIEDFSTGFYDYNLMTSVFVATEHAGARPAGAVTKVSYSAQEWCGHVYEQALFDDRALEYALHSYFDGEADQTKTLSLPPDALAEDALLLWARGFAGPVLEPGESLEVPLFRSMSRMRLQHLPVGFDAATLKRSVEPAVRRVPAGEFSVDVYECVARAGDLARTYPPGSPQAPPAARTWTIAVERTWPHRIVEWSRDDGLKASLVGTRREKYWEQNGAGREQLLREIGLAPRAARTP